MKRYRMDYGFGGDASMDEHPEGEWVKFKEYGTPELSDGYRVFRKQLLRRVDISGTWPERRVADIDESGQLWCRMPIEPEEIPALAAFLQGAR